MSDAIGVVIAGDRQIELRLDQFPKELHAVLKEAITELTDDLAARVAAAVPRRTGRLAGEITHQVYDSDQRISGRVSVSAEFAKAGALEYGAHGSASVGAHTMRLAHLWGRAAGMPLAVTVPAYSRRLNLPAQRFLRGPAEAMRDEVKAELTAAIDKTVEAAA